MTTKAEEAAVFVGGGMQIGKQYEAFRQYFIEHELRALLEKAREGDGVLYGHTIDELIEEVKKL